MTPSELKQALHSGQNIFGTLIVSPSPFWPKVIGDCGLDFVFIDTEHIALNRETVSWMCRTYRAMGLPPLVRIPNQDPDTASMVLDDGASGVVIPYVEDANTVRKMVGATKRRPIKGNRLGGSLEPELSDYIEAGTRDNLLIINIESVPAIEALDEILAVQGVDAVLIGPHDLSSSLGIPEQYGEPQFLDACREILEKARASGIGAGIHHWLEPDQQAEFVQMGANLLIHKADAIFFKTGLQTEIAQIRQQLGESVESEDQQLNL